jgi:hypothetical protein
MVCGKMRFGLLLLLLWQMASSVVAVAATETATWKERYAQFDAQIEANAFRDISDAEKNSLITKAFQQFLPTPMPTTRASIQDLSVDELNIFLRATRDTAFYTDGERYAMQMAIICEVLIEKKAITPKQIEDQYNAFIRTRLFAEATRWHKRFPMASKTTLPTLIDDANIKSGEASEWVISPDQRAVTRRRVDLSQDWMMVVVSHPFCGPSNRATKAIYADAKLANRLKGHAKWVTPQDSSIAIEALQKWNKEYSDAPVSVVHLTREWPFEKFSSTPTFYFLNAGKVVESFSGWPKEGNFDKLNAALDRIAPVVPIILIRIRN